MGLRMGNGISLVSLLFQEMAYDRAITKSPLIFKRKVLLFHIISVHILHYSAIETGHDVLRY